MSCCSILRSAALLTIFLVVAWHATLAQPDSAAWESPTRDLEQMRQELGLPEMSVAVLLNQQVFYARGFGLGEVDREITATESTPYHMASFTKPFPPVLVMRLVEAVLLTFDSRMRDLCGESVFDVNGEEVHGYQTLCEKLVGLVNHHCADREFLVRHTRAIRPAAYPVSGINTPAGCSVW